MNNIFLKNRFGRLQNYRFSRFFRKQLPNNITVSSNNQYNNAATTTSGITKMITSMHHTILENFYIPYEQEPISSYDVNITPINRIRWLQRAGGWFDGSGYITVNNGNLTICLSSNNRNILEIMLAYFGGSIIILDRRNWLWRLTEHQPVTAFILEMQFFIYSRSFRNHFENFQQLHYPDRILQPVHHRDITNSWLAGFFDTAGYFYIHDICEIGFISRNLCNCYTTNEILSYGYNNVTTGTIRNSYNINYDNTHWPYVYIERLIPDIFLDEFNIYSNFDHDLHLVLYRITNYDNIGFFIEYLIESGSLSILSYEPARYYYYNII